MGSIMDSRYWTCPSCCTQFDWEDGGAESHHPEQCRRSRAADAQWQADVQKGRKLLNKRVRESLQRDWCTDPDNCQRCKALAWDQVNHSHAGIPIGTQKTA